MESINQMKNSADQLRRKSKKLLAFTMITVATSALATTVRAQTFAEWFRQKSTQKKYLLQQIAALQVYAKYYKEGNNIAHHGLGSITGYLQSEFGLHTTYYSKLNHVSPVVKNNKQVNDILKWQNDIISRMTSLDKTTNLNNGEKKYIIEVKTALFKDCDQQLAELKNIVTDSKLQMSDEERIKQIRVIHSAMQNNYRFASAFADQVKIYAVQRVQDNNNVVSERKFYGIK